MEHALGLVLEQGAGREAAVLQNNLAIARYPLQGPALSLRDFEDGIAFCQQRGLAASEQELETNCPALLAELGRPDEAMERAARLEAELEDTGNEQDLSEVRASELALRLARGEPGAPGEPEWLIATARTVRSADASAFAFGAAAAAFASESPERASALLAELEQFPGTRESPYYSRQLAAMVRTSLACGDRRFAERLAGSLEPRYPLEEHALCAARAQVTEHAGKHAEAARLYAEAAARWQEFGNVPERAYALLGQGRCLRALGQPKAEEPLREARDLFASMGYKPALAETEALLEQTATRTA
jgi:hypothetical protein